MAMGRKEPSIDADPRDCITAWVAVLERARLDDNFERAGEAVRQLRRLGVRITFGLSAKGCKHHAR